MDAPATLPADFQFDQPEAPESLPADFFSKQQPVAKSAPAPIPQGPTIGPAKHPFLERLRMAVAGPDTALGTLGSNKTGEPLINFKELIPPGEGKARNFARGAAEGVSGLTSPQSLALIPALGGFGEVAGPLMGRLVGAGFSLQALKGLYDTAPEFKKAVHAGDYDRAAEIAGQMAVAGGVAIG